MKLSLCLSTAALALLPAIAFAQDAAPGDSWVSEVVVTGQRGSITAPIAATATRTATPIEEVPQSIQVLTSTLIEEQDLRTISDALVNVSGVTPTSTEQTVLMAPLIRGFSVNYYFDGMPTYQLPPGVADPATLANVERIEVAKGPTSTLYGGGTGAPLSGLINIVSRDPGATFGGSISVRGGSYNTWGAEGQIDIPFSERVRFSLTGMAETADSYLDVIDSRRFAVFPTLALDLSDDTALVIRGRYNQLKQQEYAGVPAALTFAPSLIIDPYQFAGASDAPRTEVENKQLTATLSHRFSERVQGSVSISRYEGSFEEFSTFPYGQIAGTLYNFGSAYLPSDTTKNFFTASLTAQLGEGVIRHQLLVGADYDQTTYFGAMYFNPFWQTLDYAAPNPIAPFGGNPPFYFDENDRMLSTAIFVQDQVAIGDRLDITAGLRWTKLHVRSTVGVTTDLTDDRVTPRIGVTYKLDGGFSVFAGYAEGFQGVVAGGFYGITPKPETSQSYEAGFKFVQPVKGLTGTLSIFQITRQNMLTPDPIIPFAYVQTGEQRSKGIELDLVYEPSPALSILFNYSDTDAKVTKDTVLPVGDRLRAVPKQTGRLAARYRFQSDAWRGLEVGAGVTAVSSRELTLPNTIAVKGMALVDAQASYDFGPATLSLSIINLTDNDGFEPYQYFGGAYVIPTQPRSAFITLRTAF
jgi:iron complex outermembrane receptor protein